MSDQAERLRPYAGELFLAFGPSPPKGWWRAYRAWDREDRREFNAAWRARGGYDWRSRREKLADWVHALRIWLLRH